MSPKAIQGSLPWPHVNSSDSACGAPATKSCDVSNGAGGDFWSLKNGIPMEY